MNSETLIRSFFTEVRSGQNLDRAAAFMAPLVLAHQVKSEDEVTLERTPQNYADHVREMKVAFGDFTLEIVELIAGTDRVYVRWKQIGKHCGVYEDFAPTGLPLVEIASATYRLENDHIIEYWIQIDRAGIRVQLERNMRTLSGSYKVIHASERVDGSSHGLVRSFGVSATTAGSQHLSMAHGIIPAGAKGQRHYHPFETALLVLSGRAISYFGPQDGESVEVGAGDFIYIGAGVIHNAENIGEGQVEYILSRAAPEDVVISA
jgi:uncharacterized RmlC-like cupin family protein/predicted ester cyclase